MPSPVQVGASQGSQSEWKIFCLPKQHTFIGRRVCSPRCKLAKQLNVNGWDDEQQKALATAAYTLAEAAYTINKMQSKQNSEL